MTARPPVEKVRRAVAGTRFTDVRWVEQTGSTNADVMALARDGVPEGVVVVADHQTAGRGRLARRWSAPPGASLLVSVLLRPPAGVAPAVTMATGVAMAEAVEQVTGGEAAGGGTGAGVSARLKWPNDLVVGDRKLAGILAEADWPPGSTASAGWHPPAPHMRLAVVVGVGVNVAWPGSPDDPPEGLPMTALNWLGARVERADLLAAFLRRLEVHYGRLVGERSAAPLVAEWRRRSATLGRRVRVETGTDEVEGTATDVTADGRLVVTTDEGQRRILAVGDVVHLRPA